jgi:hypothetical protein
LKITFDDRKHAFSTGATFRDQMGADMATPEEEIQRFLVGFF